jgi:hypothetical protein
MEYFNNISSIEGMFISYQEILDNYKIRQNINNSVDVYEVLVNKYCPEYIEEYKLSFNKYSKIQLTNLYEQKIHEPQPDFLRILHLIYCIVPYTYVDKSYLYWMGEFCKWYYQWLDAISPSRSEWFDMILSTKPKRKTSDTDTNHDYIHPFFFKCISILHIHNICSKHIEYNTSIFNSIHMQIMRDYDAVKYKCDRDHLNPHLFNVFGYMLSTIYTKFSDSNKLIAEDIKKCDFQETKFSFKYKAYSMDYIRFKLRQFTLFFSIKDFVKSFELLEDMYTYADHALHNYYKLYRGLTQFNSTRYISFGSYLYFLLKLQVEIPDWKLSISSLSNEDKNYILSRQFLENTYAKPTIASRDKIDRRYIESLQHFIDKNKETFDIIKPPSDSEFNKVFQKLSTSLVQLETDLDIVNNIMINKQLRAYNIYHR